MMMNEWLMVIFTAVIAISTVVYTVFSYRLWKATKATCDIARYTAFMAYLGTLAQEIDKSRGKNPVGAQFLENLMSIMAEAGFESFMKDIDLNKNPEARDFLVKLEGMFRGHGVDPMSIPMLRPIMSKIKK
ncbi:MAG: hypothetical protein ACOYU4_03900 [Thermodesulfobacteriota bacterium]